MPKQPKARHRYVAKVVVETRFPTTKIALKERIEDAVLNMWASPGNDPVRVRVRSVDLD